MQKIYQETVHLPVRQPIYIYNKVIIFTKVFKELALKTGNYTINTKFWHKINIEIKKKILLLK
jgi:hypothetical protein